SEEHTSELQSRENLVCRLIRSEEHTSELQSRENLVCRLLLEKKKTSRHNQHAQEPQPELDFVTYHLGAGAQSAEQRVLVVGRFFFKRNGNHGDLPSSPPQRPSD